MKFSSFKEFREYAGSNVDALYQFLSVDMTKTLRELAVGLTRLRFTDNFESFKTEVTIAAGTELAIRNEIRSGAIPTERIIVRSSQGIGDIADGDTEWNQNFVYLKNTGASDVTLTVIFLK